MKSYFGQPRQGQAWREMGTTAPPVGASCRHCGDPIAADDDGVIDEDRCAWHADCWLLQVLRKLSPDLGIPEIGRQSLRTAARDAVRAFEREARI